MFTGSGSLVCTLAGSLSGLNGQLARRLRYVRRYSSVRSRRKVPGGVPVLSIGGKYMMKNILAFIVLAFLAVPFVALAQSSISLETLNAVDIPPGSIVVLSQEETGLPGYIHQKYAFSCLGELRLVDYYGSAFDPKDQDVLEFERTMCSRQKFNDYDTE